MLPLVTLVGNLDGAGEDLVGGQVEGAGGAAGPLPHVGHPDAVPVLVPLDDGVGGVWAEAGPGGAEEALHDEAVRAVDFEGPALLHAGGPGAGGVGGKEEEEEEKDGGHLGGGGGAGVWKEGGKEED